MHLPKFALILICLVAISGCKPEEPEEPERQGCILPPPEAASYPNAATLALAASYPDAVIGLISYGQDVEVVPPNMVAMLGDDVVRVKGGKVYVNEISFGEVLANQTVKYKIEGQERHLYVGSELRHPIVENSVKHP